MKITLDTLAIAHGADKTMHAALALVGKHRYPYVESFSNYSDPLVWLSTDPAVMLLRERYTYLSGLLDWLNSDTEGLVWQRK